MAWLLLAVLGGVSPCLAAEEASPPRVYRDVVQARWQSGGDRFWYRNDLADGALEFVLIEAAEGTRAPAFDHDRVAGALSELLGEPVDSRRLPVESLELGDDGSILLIGLERSWRLDPETGELTVTADAAGVPGLPFDHRIRPSRYLGGETHVTFLNRHEQTVRIFWVDGGGGRVLYHELEPGERQRQHTFTGHIWLVVGEQGQTLAVFEAPANEGLAVISDREPSATLEPELAEAGNAAVPAPDGRQAVFVRDHNLWLRDLATGLERPLSYDGCAGDSYVMDTQRDRLVEMDYQRPAAPDSLPEVFWSPDSKFLVALRTRAVTERTVYLVESAPRDQLQPRLRSYPYLKPGDDVPIGVPHLFDVEDGREISLDRTLFATPWDLTDFHWAPDGSEIFFLYNQRGHQTMRVIAIKATTGRVRVAVAETCETFFDYQGKTYLEHLDERGQLVWMSERDGWNHLYLYDRVKGRVKKQITRGQWVVRGVERIDEEQGRIWFTAMGIVPDQDPYYVHHCRVDLDGRNLVVLTAGNGTHRIAWSPDRRFFIDGWSRVDLPPVHVLRDATDGGLICEIEQADTSELKAAGRRFPERFMAKGRDGQTDIHGIIHWPRDFAATGSYPVIESIYAGPHGQHVPKAFRAGYRLQELADRGFVVVQIDGMGTNWRSKAFHDVCWRNIVDGGFPDRILWIQAVADKYPQLDLERVGVLGGSAGGQNTVAALLTHGDFYKVGVADCGCHDNRMDKIWWNEQWMGYPVGPHYAAQSNVTLAPNLTGELFLIVGELDHNVDPASTMQVVDALVRADRDFDMLVIPGAGHGAAGTAYGRRRSMEFFSEHLSAR